MHIFLIPQAYDNVWFVDLLKRTLLTQQSPLLEPTGPTFWVLSPALFAWSAGYPATNTNPYAVEQMMQRDNIHVCHLPAMHAKVYLITYQAHPVSQSARIVPSSLKIREPAMARNRVQFQKATA